MLGDSFSLDVESKAVDTAYLKNTTVGSFAWRGISITVQDRKTGQPKAILDNVDGFVRAGEICALMGPSGCGKTTLLNALAHRDGIPGAKVDGSILVNGVATSTTSVSSFRRVSSYVEQEDSLIGSLTVKETMHFAARLAHSNALSKQERIGRVKNLLASFGLANQADKIVGTPIRKGISGGQKRRLSVASQLITGPKILFLDEPTSGLDSAASREVILFLKNFAKTYKLIVIASIHQPSTSTFEEFDKLLLLSGGKPYFFGQIPTIGSHFGSLGYPLPGQMNPAEFLLDLVNVDFSSAASTDGQHLVPLQQGWMQSSLVASTSSEIAEAEKSPGFPASDSLKHAVPTFFPILMTLIHRSFIKSYRDVVAYGIRVAMYAGLAIMMGTVWLRLMTDQADIQPFINTIFFGSAFMSFMAVAYVPSFLEDRATFVKERANGLYGAAVFNLSNFIIGLPYLFFIAVLFSSISYWLINLRPTAEAFFMWIMWLFIDLIAAESLVVFMSSLFPNFVIALALTAFANGLWMSVGGFLVPPDILNVFWRYAFHYIDYQTYVFQGMMVNEFAKRTYSCGEGCRCMYATDLESQCMIAGKGVLDQYGYKTGETGKWIGILFAIVFGYRLLGWLALSFRK